MLEKREKDLGGVVMEGRCNCGILCKICKKPRRDYLWDIMKYAWRGSSVIGTSLFVLGSTGVWFYGWLINNSMLIEYAKTGFLPAVMLGISGAVWKGFKIFYEREMELRCEIDDKRRNR